MDTKINYIYFINLVVGFIVLVHYCQSLEYPNADCPSKMSTCTRFERDVGGEMGICGKYMRKLQYSILR